MKRSIISLIICLLAISVNAVAQVQPVDGPAEQPATALVAISPYVTAEIAGVPEVSVKSLNHKLTQMVTQNGFGSTSGAFILTCQVLPLTKEAIPTMPVKYSLELEVSFYLVNTLEKVIVAEYPVTVKAIANSENGAYNQALKLVNPRSPKLRAFMDRCREKITEYYALKLPALVAKAEALAHQDKYEESLAILGSIPESVPEYIKVQTLSTEIHTKMLDRDAVIQINKARAAIAQKDFDAALKHVNAVHPASTLSSKAYAMIDEISSKMEEEERLAKEEELRLAQEQKAQAEKVWNDNVELEKLKIEAAKKTAVAQAKVAAEQSDQSFLKEMNSWLLGKMAK